MDWGGDLVRFENGNKQTIQNNGSAGLGYWIDSNPTMTDFGNGGSHLGTVERGMKFVKVGEAFYTGNSKSSTWKGNAWNWMKEHVDVAGGYSLSFGAQIGGGFKEGLAARINIYSTVHSDVEFSYKKGIKGTQDGMYNPGEKNNWGIGAAYYLGFDYKGQIYKGVKEHELSLG